MQQQNARNTDSFKDKSNFRVIETKKEVLNKMLKKWKEKHSDERISNYYKDIERLLKEVDYDPTKMSKKVYENYGQKREWEAKNTWPLTAWNSFCRYGNNIAPKLFSKSAIINKNKSKVKSNLTKIMKREIEDIISTNITPTGGKYGKRMKNKFFSSMEAFKNYVQNENPKRTLKILTDFTAADANKYRNHLYKTQKSPITENKVTINTISSFVYFPKRLYKLGYELNKLKKNIFVNVKVIKQRIKKRKKILTEEEIEKLRTVDEEKLAEMTLYKKFIQKRNNTLVSFQYEPALRSEEVVNLAYEDLPKDERNKNNIGPVIVRGINAKARADDEDERVYMLMDRLDKDLYEYQKVREEFCEKYNITPPKIKIDGRVFNLIFFTVNGTPITAGNYISNIFASQLKKAGINLKKGYKSHILRHSKLSHWVQAGYAFEKLHIKARHRNLKQTWNYYHDSIQNRIKAVEKVHGLDDKSKTITTSALPQKGVLKRIIKVVAEEVEKYVDSKKPESVKTYEIVHKVKKQCVDYAESALYYNFREVMDKFNLGRTQTYARLKKLQKAGKITPIKQKNNRVLYLKNEIAKYTTLIDSKKATVAFGYNEKVPSTIPSMASRGLLKSIKIGKLHFFEPTELIDYFYNKNK